MPTISANRATRIAEKLFQGAGAPEDESKIVARHVIMQTWPGMIATVLYRSLYI